jgi:hypothetical protein
MATATTYLPDVAASGIGYVNTYTPLCALAPGRLAIVRHGLAPFEDASCRREPDLAHPLAPITAVCRGRNFVTRLRPGTAVIYLTKKMHGGYYLAGALKVLQTLTDQDAHAQLAATCQRLGLRLPGNCMVLPDNPPLPLSYTGGQRSKGRETLAALRGDDSTVLIEIIRKWDGAYRWRVRQTPTVALCAPHFVELSTPPFVTVQELEVVFGRIPGTRNPGEVGLKKLNELLVAKGIGSIT